MVDRLVVIGGVAAGTKAAATARRRNPLADIVVLQAESDVSYSACGLPYHLEDPDAIPRRKLVARTVEEFRRDRIDMRVRHRVEEIDTGRQRLTVLETESGRRYSEPYDRLLIATGASPIRPAITSGVDALPSAGLRTLGDADALLVQLPQLRNVVILGGGYIGLEAAESFAHRGIGVTVVEAKDRLLPGFAPAIGGPVADLLQSSGVRVIAGRGVAALERDGVVLSDGERIDADLLLVAAGVRPQVDLARQAGTTLGPTGAIAVTAGMETNVTNVYAAGDCAESTHIVSGRPVWLPLGDVANRHGRVAGINMAGGQARFPGVLGTAIFGAFGMAVARTGLDEKEAAAAGFDPVAEQVEAPSRAKYMASSRKLRIHMVADRKTGRVLGCQIAGLDAVDKIVDTVAAALLGKLTVSDLADLDLAYAPPFSPVAAPVQIAGEILRKRCET